MQASMRSLRKLGCSAVSSHEAASSFARPRSRCSSDERNCAHAGMSNWARIYGLLSILL